ncbi:hypothetical protein A9299_10155 [Moraxella osloensis]|uniref:Uncharacterized protein n=1 Tax=Faucicola osloensis TaxID=34062 RepID=A0AA91J9U8_FAUOS|nr:hypothetical protein [Moraxella osloensis]OBX64279.1 hypothetical protein A9299_10155 [Moraxella osloensis]
MQKTLNDFDKYPKQIEPQDFCNQGLIYITSLGEENIYFEKPNHEGELYLKGFNPDNFKKGFFDTSILKPYQKVRNAYDKICFDGTPQQKRNFQLLEADYAKAGIFDAEEWEKCYHVLQLESLII